MQRTSCGQCKCWTGKPGDRLARCERHAPQATCVPASMRGQATTMWPATDAETDGCWEGVPMELVSIGGPDFSRMSGEEIREWHAGVGRARAEQECR